MNRRDFMMHMSAGAAAGLLPLAASASPAGRVRVGASWRGPHPGDAAFAGVLEADTKPWGIFKTMKIGFLISGEGTNRSLIKSVNSRIAWCNID